MKGFLWRHVFCRPCIVLVSPARNTRKFLIECSGNSLAGCVIGCNVSLFPFFQRFSLKNSQQSENLPPIIQAPGPPWQKVSQIRQTMWGSYLPASHMSIKAFAGASTTCDRHLRTCCKMRVRVTCHISLCAHAVVLVRVRVTCGDHPPDAKI